MTKTNHEQDLLWAVQFLAALGRFRVGKVNGKFSAVVRRHGYDCSAEGDTPDGAIISLAKWLSKRETP